MSFRYFRSTSGEGTSTALFRCPADGKGVFEQPSDAVEIYRPDGTWQRGQGSRLQQEATSGWFVESDDEISIERAMQLMSRISEAAQRQGRVITPPIPATTRSGPSQSTPPKALPPQPEKKSKPIRRRITIGAVIFVAAWIILIYNVFNKHHDEPIIHPIHSGMSASTVADVLDLVGRDSIVQVRNQPHQR